MLVVLWIYKGCALTKITLEILSKFLKHTNQCYSVFLDSAGLVPNGLYWYSYTDILDEGSFVPDPDLPNEREIRTPLTWY